MTATHRPHKRDPKTREDIDTIMSMLRKALDTGRLPYEAEAMKQYIHLNFALAEDWLIEAAIYQLRNYKDE